MTTINHDSELSKQFPFPYIETALKGFLHYFFFGPLRIHRLQNKAINRSSNDEAYPIDLSPPFILFEIRFGPACQKQHSEKNEKTEKTEIGRAVPCRVGTY
jgi:hypothetical protein